MHHPTDRIAHTTAFVTPVVEHWLEREIAQWFHPMKDRSDDPSHHDRTLLPLSYISLACVHVWQATINKYYILLFLYPPNNLKPYFIQLFKINMAKKMSKSDKSTIPIPVACAFRDQIMTTTNLLFFIFIIMLWKCL